MKRTLATAACLILLASCQRGSDDQMQNPATNSDRVKTYTETITSSSYGNSSTTYNISYDNSGRVTGIVSAAAPGDKFNYAYPSANLYTMDLYNAGALSIHEDFYLNASGLPDSTFQINDTQDTTTEKHVYNSNQQLIELKEYTYSKATGSELDNTTMYTYDANGNLVQTIDSNGEGHSYEYYSDLSYALPVAVGPITDNSTKKQNLVKTHTLTYNGAVEGSAAYTYTFDDKGRLSTENAVASDGSVVLKSYTYF